MPVFKNTYRKLDQDTSYNKVDPTSYYDCRNFRINSNDSSKSGALTVVKGNHPLSGSFISLLYPNDKVIGSVRIRDYMILFTTNDDTRTPTASSGRIWRAPFYNDAVVMSDMVLLYDGLLNFSQQNPIEEAISFYESDDIQKIYWTDKYNYFRYANIATYLTSDGLVKSGTNTYIDPDHFNIVQQVDLSTPTLDAIISGNIPVGMVQYAYRLYKLNGPTSNFSPASHLIPLSESPLSLQYTTEFKGSDKLNDSGGARSSQKGVTIKITGIDTDYDRIEIVAIHYAALNDAPNVWIVDIKPVSSTIYSTDEGIYNLGSYSLAEFTLLNNPFKCKTIAAKNNILFAGDIIQNEFDFDYDARAYRWANTGSSITSRMFESNGDYYYNNASNNNWIHYNSSNVIVPPAGYTTANLPADLDCINPYNKLIPSASEQFKFKKNGLTLGGEGVNVSYTFEETDISANYRWIDNLGSNVHETFGGRSTVVPYYYNSSESPLMNQQTRTFARDEVYRVGFIGYDELGRYSPVKWIGDIKFPNNEDMPMCSGGSGAVYSRPYMLQVVLNNLPATVQYVQIVSVKRTDNDKTVQCQGKLNFIDARDSEYFMMRPSWSVVHGTYHAGYSYISAQSPHFLNRHVMLVSPEISFYKDFNQGANDYLEIIGTMSAEIEQPSTSFESLKYHTFVASTRRFHPVVSSRILNTTSTPDEIAQRELFGTLNGYPFYSFCRFPVGSDYRAGNVGTCLLVQMSTALNISGLPDTYMIVNYRKNRWGSQYGGNTSEDRSRNEYIPASEIVAVSTGSATVKAKQGDVFINYADHLTSYYNNYYAEKSNADTFAAVEMFPVETTVNLAYRLDDCYHRIYNKSAAAMWIREVGNASFTANTIDYALGWSNLYLENTVYKRQADARKFYPAPLDYTPEYSNDTLVMASDMKEGLETFDAWTQWASNENITVDKNYGPLNKLLAWKNLLLYWQTDAVGVLSVLDRSVIADQEGKSTTLGQGTVLQRYDYISTKIGLNTRFSITQSLNGVYWYDHKRRRMHRFLNNIEDLSTIRGVNSYFNDLTDDYAYYDNVISAAVGGKGFFMSYNPMYNEVWLTVKENPNYGLSLLYNEILDAYVGFVDTVGYYFMTYDNKVFSCCDQYIYREDKGYPGKFYGRYYDSYVSVVVNPMPNMTTTLTNLEISSEVYEAELDPVVPWIKAVNPGDSTGPIVIPPVLTLYIPTLNTVAPVLSGLSATSGGGSINDGNARISEKGVVYGTSPNPTYESSSKTSDGDGAANFVSTIGGLVPDSLYYVRAYAKNSVGVGYGLSASLYTYETLMVQTRYIDSITYNSARAAIYISRYNSNEDIGLVTYGVCWSTSPNPTIADDRSAVTEERSSVTYYPMSSILGLAAGTTYYVRAYATNSKGTAYGEQLAFTTISTEVGDVITTGVTAITTSGASSGGTVTDDHGFPVTSRGVCWSTSVNPTVVAGSYVASGSGMGSFTSAITGLAPGTIYFVRAFAVNAAGTSYGNNIGFTTTKAAAATDLVDKDGNVYTTVKINNQEWIVENFMCSKYADGVSINYLPDALQFDSDTAGAFCYYENNISLKSSIGALYNWYAVNNARSLAYLERNGVQESGWRVPSTTDWNNLRTFLGGLSVAGGALKETGSDYWHSGNIGATNSSGFRGRGSGQRLSGNYTNLGYQGNYWSSVSQSTTTAWYYQLLSAGPQMYSFDNALKRYGYAVRLVRDYTPPAAPSAPEIPGILPASHIGYTTFQANWLSALRAEKYYLDVATDAAFTSFVTGYNNRDVSAVTSFIVVGLTLNTQYWYRVRAYGNTLTSDSSASATFTTLNTAVPPQPTATGYTDLAVDSFKPTWDASPGATGYRLDVSTDYSFGSFVGTFNNKDVGNVLTVLVDGLSAGVTYYFRVRAYNGTGTSPSSNIFTVTCPPLAQGSLSLSPNSVNFYGTGVANSKTITVTTSGLTFWEFEFPDGGNIYLLTMISYNANGTSEVSLYYEGNYGTQETVIFRGYGINGDTIEETLYGFWL